MYNPFSLEGKKILVTGASSSIGRQVAIECSKLGASLIITGRNMNKLNETFSLLYGNNHKIILCDITVEDEVNELVENCSLLDGISNNIGISKVLFVKFINQSILNEVLNVNALAPILLIQNLVRKKKLAKNASIVFTSSLSGIYSVHYGDSVNATSKGAINAFSKGAALDLASNKIRVNCVNPGIIFTESTLQNTILTEDEMNKKKDYFPLKRFGKPQDVASAIVFLLSDASTWITGINLPIDGGYTLL